MTVTIQHRGREYKADLLKPIDISISMHTGDDCVRAWYVDPMRLEPVVSGQWIGDVNQGGSVNFRNVKFNPHGNGTHTECVGHISKEFITINQSLVTFFFVSKLITVVPVVSENGDLVIGRGELERLLAEKENGEALIIRTPNYKGKVNTNYSNTNPPYLTKEAILFLNELGILHLLIDLPSIDRESDEGRLEAHHAFWNYPVSPRLDKTITELIYVPDEVADGLYLLNIQIAPLENDASPSKPVLYRLM